MHKRFLGALSKKTGNEPSEKEVTPTGDSPEATIVREVRAFCHSGGPNNSGEEVLHLPVIVEAAESSPRAAAQAATEIKKYLSSKNHQQAHIQYNAMMLVRILTDNPGQSFTQNFDAKFVANVKEVLKYGADPSVQQILRETLDLFEKKTDDPTLAGMNEMWKREKNKYGRRASAAPLSVRPPPTNAGRSNYHAPAPHSRNLPPPAELAQRVEEAKTSAKLLSQLCQSTPAEEVLQNDLIKEFADRCQSASRSMQHYMNSSNPAPDEDTLLTLIETNDQLASSMSRHQRAVLQARRAAGLATPSPRPPEGGQEQEKVGINGGNKSLATGFLPPPGPPPGRTTLSAGPQQAQTSDPFADDAGAAANSVNRGDGSGLQAPLVPAAAQAGVAADQGREKPRYRF